MLDSGRIRARFFGGLLRGMGLVWPVASGLIGVMALLGIAVSLLEGWRILDGIYFAFVTGLTVGYGDLVPTRTLSRIAAIVIGLTGILLTGLLAAISVLALQQAIAAERALSDKATQDGLSDKS